MRISDEPAVPLDHRPSTPTLSYYVHSFAAGERRRTLRTERTPLREPRFLKGERLPESASELPIIESVDAAVAVEVERGVEAGLTGGLPEREPERAVVGGVDALAAVDVAEEPVERQRRIRR